MADHFTSALLVAAGGYDTQLLCELYENSQFVIAVDGGVNTLLRHNMAPSALVGDLDSAMLESVPDDVLTIKLDGQQESDLVKCLLWAITQGARELDVIGVEAGESDHILGTYAALSDVSMGQHRDARIRLHHVDTIVHLLCSGMNWFADLPENKRITIFVLGSPAKISMNGVRWPLNNESLRFSTRGLHNESVGGAVEVKVFSGNVLLFVHRS